MADIGFIDFDSIPESDGFEAIPAGDYTVVITNSEVKDNKKGNGKFAKFTFQVCDGQFTNRLLWHYVNFQHVNSTTQNIGRRELKELGLACGQTTFSDTAALHNIPIRIRVDVEDDDRGGKRNVVKRVLWKETGSKPVATSTPAASPKATAGPAEDDSDHIPF